MEPRPAKAGAQTAIERALEEGLAILTGASEPGEYRADQYEDPEEVKRWFEELFEEYGLADATPEEQSKFLDGFINGVVGDPPPDHNADA